MRQVDQAHAPGAALQTTVWFTPQAMNELGVRPDLQAGPETMQGIGYTVLTGQILGGFSGSNLGVQGIRLTPRLLKRWMTSLQEASPPLIVVGGANEEFPEGVQPPDIRVVVDRNAVPASERVAYYLIEQRLGRSLHPAEIGRLHTAQLVGRVIGGSTKATLTSQNLPSRLRILRRGRQQALGENAAEALERLVADGLMKFFKNPTRSPQ